jgi:hypothetical protein
VQRRRRLVVVGAGEQDRLVAGGGQQLGHDGRALLGRLARSVYGLDHALAQHPVVVDAGEAQVGVGETP